MPDLRGRRQRERVPLSDESEEVVIEIYTSHWRNPELGDLDAVIVSISRGEPRWRVPFRYKRMSELAPGDTAWNAEDEESYEAAYLRQLEDLGARRIVEALEQIGADRPAVMLCWERPGEWCHRRMLADYIERETGIMVRELRPGDLPERQDVPEPRLFHLAREEDA